MFQRLQEDFGDVTMSHIPRNKNGRVDALAKEARIRGFIFFHIDKIRPDQNAHRRIGSFEKKNIYISQNWGKVGNVRNLPMDGLK